MLGFWTLYQKAKPNRKLVVYGLHSFQVHIYFQVVCWRVCYITPLCTFARPALIYPGKALQSSSLSNFKQRPVLLLRMIAYAGVARFQTPPEVPKGDSTRAFAEIVGARSSESFQDRLAEFAAFSLEHLGLAPKANVRDRCCRSYSILHGASLSNYSLLLKQPTLTSPGLTIDLKSSSKMHVSVRLAQLSFWRGAPRVCKPW